MEEPAPERQLGYREEEGGEGVDRASHAQQQQQQKVEDLQGDARGQVRESSADRLLLAIEGSNMMTVLG